MYILEIINPNKEIKRSVFFILFRSSTIQHGFFDSLKHRRARRLGGLSIKITLSANNLNYFYQLDKLKIEFTTHNTKY